MPQLITQIIADGNTSEFPFDFPYVSSDSIRVLIGDTHEKDWRFNATGTSVVLRAAPPAGTLVEIDRHTTSRELVTFTAPALELGSDLTASFTQTLHIAEEAKNFLAGAIIFSPILQAYDAKGHRIANVGLAINPDDVATYGLVRQILLANGVVPPPTEDIDAALLALTPVLVAVEADAADVYAKYAQVIANYNSMTAIVASLTALAADPEPHCPELIDRLDAFLGQTTWRNVVTDPNAVELFTATGTWTKPDPLTHSYKFALVECWAGGAAGASFTKDSTVQTGIGPAPSIPGAGGGSYKRRIVTLSDLPDTLPVVVGQGGLPSAGYTDLAQDGGDSSFGTLLSAQGGKAPRSPLDGGKGGNPNGIRIRLPNGTYLGDGGHYVERTNYLTPSSLPSGGEFHAGGGGVGHGTDPANNHQDPAFDGASSLNGGGGGGAGYTPHLGYTPVAPKVTELAYKGVNQFAIPNDPANPYHYVRLKDGKYLPAGAMTVQSSIRYLDTSGYTPQFYTVDQYQAAFGTNEPYNTVSAGNLVGYGTVNRTDLSGKYLVIDLGTGSAARAASYFLPGKGGSSVSAGPGGDGGLQGQPGRPGSIPSGAGGGAGTPSGSWYNSPSIILGGKGARGQVKVTYW